MSKKKRDKQAKRGMDDFGTVVVPVTDEEEAALIREAAENEIVAEDVKLNETEEVIEAEDADVDEAADKYKSIDQAEVEGETSDFLDELEALTDKLTDVQPAGDSEKKELQKEIVRLRTENAQLKVRNKAINSTNINLKDTVYTLQNNLVAEKQNTLLKDVPRFGSASEVPEKYIGNMTLQIKAASLENTQKFIAILSDKQKALALHLIVNNRAAAERALATAKFVV